MNNKEYIASGIIEDYVLGLVSPQEAMEVERMASLHPEIKEEINQIQNALERYVQSQSKTPPPALKAKIWSAIQTENVNLKAVPHQGAKITEVTQLTNYSKWFAAATVALLIGSSILNISLYFKWKTVQSQLTDLNKEKEYYVQQVDVQKTALEKTKNEFAFLSNSSTKVVSLKGVEKFPDANATAYWNTNTHEVYLAINTLPVPPSDKQYQLWAIVDGKPVDAGVFDINASGETLHKMKNFESAQAFAITLEVKGGSISPTMENMYVIGNI